MTKKVIAVLFGAVLATAPAFAAGEARTMFLGDSITHLGFCEYYLQLVENLRHPGSEARYYNAGFGGGTLQTGIANCKHEIERVRPSRIVVMFGMNDIGWTAFETNEVIRAERKEVADKCLSTYRENCRRLLSEIRGLGVTNIVFATPTPYDEYSRAAPSVRRRNVNEYGLKGMAGIVREIARAENLLCVDLNAPMTEVAARHPEIAWCGGDRVHPGRLGYLFMATQYLAAFGEMRPVASVDLTADGKIVSCENAKVDEVVRSADGLAFVYRPQALPFPPLPEYAQLKSLYPEAQKINCEALSVKGLREGVWRLCVDGRELGAFTSRQFADGVNLAELDTPNRRIAAKAAEAMTALHDFDQPRRDRACVRRKYESFGVPMDDKKALTGAVDKYLAKLKADKYPWYGWEKKAAGEFLDAIGRDGEILADEERLYHAMSDIRPVAVRIEIKKVPSRPCSWAESANRPLLIYNGDADEAYNVKFHADPDHYTEDEFRKYLSEIIDSGTVTHFFINVNSRVADFPSKTVSPYWACLDDPTMDHPRWIRAAKEFAVGQGKDKNAISIDMCRARKVSPWISIRMNDVHYADDPKAFPNVGFWKDHPEFWRVPHAKCRDWREWQDRAFDYSHPEVRQWILAFIAEVLERYDADGIEIDWMRFSCHLPKGRERELSGSLDEVMRQVRRLADAAAKRRGHPVRVAARVDSDPVAAFNRGTDYRTWAKEGLVDWLIPCNFFGSADFELPYAKWADELRRLNPSVTVVPGLDVWVCIGNVRRALTSDEYCGWGERMYAQGAPGAYLFNFITFHPVFGPTDVWKVVIGQGFTPDAIKAHARSIPAGAWRECTPWLTPSP